MRAESIATFDQEYLLGLTLHLRTYHVWQVLYITSSPMQSPKAAGSQTAPYCRKSHAAVLYSTWEAFFSSHLKPPTQYGETKILPWVYYSLTKELSGSLHTSLAYIYGYTSIPQYTYDFPLFR